MSNHENNSNDRELDRFVARASSRDLSAVPALSAFQAQLERYPTVPAEQQRDLILQVRAGREAGEQLAAGGVHPRDERRLRRSIRDGERAAEQLVGSTFRLVLLIAAEKARNRYGIERVGQVLPDLVAEANVAVAESLLSYDPDRCPFSTYCARVVRDRIQYALSREGPVKVASSWHRLRRIAAVRIPQMTEQLGRKPTLEEIHADLYERAMEWAFDRLTDTQKDLPNDKREELQIAKLRKQGVLGALASLSDVLAVDANAASLDAPVGDGASTMGDLIADDPGDDPFSRVEHDEMAAVMRDALGDLNDRERRIVELRFGFTDHGSDLTYVDIAAEFGVSAERVRQIEKNALKRLATNPDLRFRLAGFLPGI